jgi:pilus assembly protein Flp/PilA
MVALHLWIQYVVGQLKDREDGAAAVEYGLLVGLIAVAIIITVTALGTKLDSLFNDICVALPVAAPAC